MARRGNPRSLLRKRVLAVERVKPQLRRARGRFTRVRFFSLRSQRVEIIGDLCLKDGVIHAEPPDSLALRNVLAEPVWVPDGDGWRLIYATLQPEEFLKAIVRFCGHGSYCWCEAVA